VREEAGEGLLDYECVIYGDKLYVEALAQDGEFLLDVVDLVV